MKIPRFDILGVPAHSIDFESAVRVVSDILDDNNMRQYIVALNAEKIMMARRDSEIMRILEDAFLLIPDGVGIDLARRILYGKGVPRVTGFDLFLKLIRVAAERKNRVYLLGATEEVIDTAKSRLAKDHRGLNVIGYHHGYFGDDNKIIDLVNAGAPDMLFVGMGSPKQEKWIYRNIHRLRVKLCFGVGGSFDIIAGRARLAPAAIRKLGFEFVYRLIKEPKRIRRQLVFPHFLASLFATRIGLTGRYSK